jgi:3-methyladenine DNA glycosylase AlkD
MTIDGTLVEEITSRLKTTAHTTPALRAVRREYTKHIRDAEPRAVIRLALGLQKSGVVHRFFSDELVANHKGAMASLTRADIEKLGRGMDSWDKVDCFGTIVAGPAWRMGRVDDEVIAEWALSNDRWWRRAALVCTTRLNVKGTKGDAKRTLTVCEVLMMTATIWW